MFLINKQNIGFVIKQARKKANLKQSELSEIAGFSEKHLSRIENGKYLPKLEHFLILTSILHLTLKDFGITNNEPTNPKKSELSAKIRASTETELELYSEAFDYIDKITEYAKAKKI